MDFVLRQRDALRWIAPVCLTWWLSACVAPESVHPSVSRVDDATLGLAPSNAAVQAHWWTDFADPQLTLMIECGLRDNPTLDIAIARLEAARAQVAESRSGLLPSLSGNAQVARARIGDKLVPPPVGGPSGTLFQMGASFNWDLDLFGRQRDLMRSAEAHVRAAGSDEQAARLFLSVVIAQTYVNLTRAYQQVGVAEGIVATRQRSVELITARRHNDLASDFELQTGQTLLAQAQQARTRALRDRDVLVHALAALVGRGADFYGDVHPPQLTLTVAPRLPLVIPANLLARRPDIAASRARIDAAVDNRRAAAAAFLPDIDIGALAGLAAFGVGNFLKAGAGYYSAGPALSLPIFEGGRLRAQYAQSTADLDASVAAYNDAVFTAVRDSADAITNVRAADEDVSEQLRVVAGLRNTVHLNQVRVSTGLASQLDAIDTGFRLLEAEQDLVRLRADTLLRRIELIAALGGGFSDDVVDPSLKTRTDQHE